jgi:hypothetical protein
MTVFIEHKDLVAVRLFSRQPERMLFEFSRPVFDQEGDNWECYYKIVDEQSGVIREGRGCSYGPLMGSSSAFYSATVLARQSLAQLCENKDEVEDPHRKQEFSKKLTFAGPRLLNATYDDLSSRIQYEDVHFTPSSCELPDHYSSYFQKRDSATPVIKEEIGCGDGIVSFAIYRPFLTANGSWHSYLEIDGLNPPPELSSFNARPMGIDSVDAIYAKLELVTLLLLPYREKLFDLQTQKKCLLQYYFPFFLTESSYSRIHKDVEEMIERKVKEHKAKHPGLSLADSSHLL